MSPLSVLPGRVRYESNLLIGSREGSLLFEESILCAKGVLEASVSHRTGRILVRFDEKLVNQDDLEGYLGKALESAVNPGACEAARASARNTVPTSEASSFSAGQFVMDLALHALLPAPLDLLFPAAASVFRR